MSKRARLSGLLLVLLAIAVGSIAVYALNKDPNILLAKPCPVQPAPIPLTFSATKGDTVGTAIGVKDGNGDPFTQNVIWSLADQTGCTAVISEQELNCAQNVYKVKVMAGSVSPTSASGQVQITTGKLADSNAKEGQFSATVTKAPAGLNDPQCTWTYVLRVTSKGGGWGDPHMTTVDDVHYDFQGAGEYTALKGDKFEIQTRQKPVPTTTVPGGDEYTGLGVCVSIYTAVAALIGSNRVSLQPDPNQPDSSDLQLFVNGTSVPLPSDGGEYILRAGVDHKGEFEGRIVKAPRGAYYEFDDAKGTQLVAAPAYWESQKTWYMNLSVYQTSATQGIWGRLADDSWLPALPDGTNVGRKPQSMDPNPDPDFLLKRYQALYDKFGTAWRVTDSKFTYATDTKAPATNTATFTVADWPRFKPQNCLIPGQKTAEPTTPEIAAQACNGITDPVQKADCIFDVRVTGNTGFAQTYTTMQGFQPNGSGWQPVIVAMQGGPPTTSWPWWWWILILILIVIIIVVVIAKKKKTP